MKKVLITGASGRIGSRLIPYLKEDYSLVLADKDVSSLTDWNADTMTVHSLDIVNKEECERVCDGVDVVIHLAGNPSPSTPYDEVKTVNMDGTYNMMAAAKEAGVTRFVFASSIHAVKGYPEDVQVKTDSPVRPLDLYGVGKVFGEALGNYFAYQEGMEVIAIRIGGHMSIELGIKAGKQPKKDQRSSYISERDMNQLIKRCIEAELDEPFLLVHGISDNEYNYLDLSDTKKKLGYRPEDDGFRVFETYQ
ncbi:NAD-dependent glucose-6-phosphate dehydrogenase Azf [Alkalibacterium iburiense]|uniref:NAD-dependent glucose-6-phosphate dehydrogenase Azf n=1 Tax=Alkalibacterium iburiense TaxID=290589 RepID=A0ABN0XMG1_9LACT